MDQSEKLDSKIRYYLLTLAALFGCLWFVRAGARLASRSMAMNGAILDVKLADHMANGTYTVVFIGSLRQGPLASL